jgi:hypothetical protein
LFKNSNDKDRDRGSGSASPTNSPSFTVKDENYIEELLDDEDLDSSITNVSKYIKTTVDSSVQTNTPLHVDSSEKINKPLHVDSSVQTDILPNIDSSVQTITFHTVDSSVQTITFHTVDSSVQTDIPPLDYKNIMFDILEEDSSDEYESLFSDITRYNKTFVDTSVQTDILPNIDSSVQTDILLNVVTSVQTDSSLKGENILDETTKNEILQLFSQITPEDLKLEDIEDTINPENIPESSSLKEKVLETSLVKNPPAFTLKKSVKFIDEPDERIFSITPEELKGKKKGYKVWLEPSNVEDSDYEPSPISPLEESP